MTSPSAEQPDLDRLERHLWGLSIVSDLHLVDAVSALFSGAGLAAGAVVEASALFEEYGVRLPAGTSVTVPGPPALREDQQSMVGGATGRVTEPVKFCLGGVCLVVQLPFEHEVTHFDAEKPPVLGDRARRYQLAVAALLADLALLDAVDAVVSDLDAAHQLDAGEQVDIAGLVGARGIRLPAGTTLVVKGSAASAVDQEEPDVHGGASGGGGGNLSLCWGTNPIHCIVYHPILVLEL